ncbi:MAG: choice-of-anchor V domain-containing protein [Myxococcaceae bacterium]
MKPSLRSAFLVGSFLLCGPAALANSGGVNGRSGRPEPGTGSSTCTACHTGGTGAAAFSGANPLAAMGGTTVNLTFTVGGGGGGVGGCDIATDSPYATLKPIGGTTFAFKRDELYQNGTGTRTWNFSVDIPNVTGSFKIYGAGLAGGGGGTGGTTGAAVLTINTTATPGAPSILTQPALNGATSPITTKNVSLSVLGSDAESAETALNYTWSADSVSFSPNGTNAAKTSTATFTKAGTYNLTVVVTDPQNNKSAPGSVMVTVNAAPIGGVLVSPAEVTVPPNGTFQFMAKATDQFGGDVATQPTLTWSIATGAAGGTVSSTGLYKAPNRTLTTPVIIYAQSSPYTGAANVTVANGSPPKISGGPSGVLNNLSATLAVTATDDGDANAMTYEWSKISGPGTATFDPNNNNAAKNTTATFSEAGNYRLQVRVKDAQGLPTSAFVDVNAGTYGAIGSGGGGENVGGDGGTTDGGTGGGGGGGGCSCNSANLGFFWAALGMTAAAMLRRRVRR